MMCGGLVVHAACAVNAVGRVTENPTTSIQESAPLSLGTLRS